MTQQADTLTQTQHLFILEDNLELLHEVTCMAAGAGYAVHSARCLNDAVTGAAELHGELSAGDDAVCVALVDLMVPETAEELEKLDRLAAERDEILDEHIPLVASAPGAGAVREAREKVGRVDQQVRDILHEPLQGLGFLVALSDQDIGWPVVVFSARGESEAKVRRAVDKAVGSRLSAWLWKPTDPVVVMRAIATASAGAGPTEAERNEQ